MLPLLIHLIAAISIGQVTIAEPQQHREEYFLHGKILLDERSYGGMYREYDEETNAHPAKGVKLQVVKTDGPSPKVMGTVSSDVNGRFSIKLPPGSYSFVRVDETPEKGQYLPKDVSTKDESNSSSSTWSCNIALPVEIKNSDRMGIHLTNRRSYSCHLCP